MTDFGATLEIWVLGVSVRDGINGVARSVGCHVWGSVELADTETLTGEFVEGRLAQMDREVAIVMTCLSG